MDNDAFDDKEMVRCMSGCTAEWIGWMDERIDVVKECWWLATGSQVSYFKRVFI